jgi:hypothetical protein
LLGVVELLAIEMVAAVAADTEPELVLLYLPELITLLQLVQAVLGVLVL